MPNIGVASLGFTLSFNNGRTGASVALRDFILGSRTGSSNARVPRMRRPRPS